MKLNYNEKFSKGAEAVVGAIGNAKIASLCQQVFNPNQLG